MLKDLGRNHVTNDKLWELVDRVNHLTQGDYESWDDNALVLVPLMQRILLLSREQEEWQVYFYDMAKLFWYIRRTKINNLSLAFKIAEMFHKDYEQMVGENVSSFGREWRVNLAAKILDFYCEYPQIDDDKIQRMLEIFQDCERRYGGDWNNGDYASILRLALLNKDKELAKTAQGRIKKAQYRLWCYVCTYARPMLGYHVLYEEFEEASDLLRQVCSRSIPVKYRWCFDRCEQASEKEMVKELLVDCLQLGKSRQFGEFFAQWNHIYREPEQGEIDDTYDVLFHAFAGDWSRQEERLLLAQADDSDRIKQKETPLDCLYWSLCWYCYFQMLGRTGVENVSLELGEGSSKSGEWSCLEAAGYFERQADLLGRQMDQVRKKFGYKMLKKTYEECFLHVVDT